MGKDMNAAKNFIHKIRLGDHPKKTRIVFETQEKTAYSIGTDPSNKMMVVTFPKAQYSNDPASRARLSDRIKNIHQNKTAEGASFAFKLDKLPKKTKDFRMSPDEDVSRQRVVIDLVY